MMKPSVIRKTQYLDPLYVIFEKYLFDFPYDNIDYFVASVVNEYLDYLKERQVHVPDNKKKLLINDLSDEVHQMLIKRIHGCLNLQDYQSNGQITKLDKLLARERYKRLR